MAVMIENDGEPLSWLSDSTQLFQNLEESGCGYL